ncbi:MAG TPA: DciA family protein [Pyrinomonadaceae bacterium]|nr:DciA family protein [Pyrinomonadaceae bacterium]
MESLIKALPALLKSSHAPEEVAEAACIAMWKQAVGEGLSAHAVPIQLREQRLTVAVEDNLWKRQLEQMRGQLLSRMNYVLGQGIVKSIELRVEPKQVVALRGAAPEAKKEDYQREVPAELVSVAATIEVVSLRRAFLGAATSCIRRIERSEI